jgi:hypothetical protein
MPIHREDLARKLTALWATTCSFQWIKAATSLITLLYFGARLLVNEWRVPGDGLHQMFPVRISLHQKPNETVLTAYAVFRADNKWAILLINKSATRDFDVGIDFEDKGSDKITSFTGPVEVLEYSRAQ